MLPDYVLDHFSATSPFIFPLRFSGPCLVLPRTSQLLPQAKVTELVDSANLAQYATVGIVRQETDRVPRQLASEGQPYPRVTIYAGSEQPLTAQGEYDQYCGDREYCVGCREPWSTIQPYGQPEG